MTQVRVGSRTVAPGVHSPATPPWWARPDPYWDEYLFEIPFKWEYPSQVIPDERIGRKRVSKFSQPPHVVLSNSTLIGVARRAQAVAQLLSWHHLNTSQLAAYSGWGTTKSRFILGPLFRGGVIERARPRVTTPAGKATPGTDYVWRIRFDTPLAQYLNQFPEPERYAITGGQDPNDSATPSSHARHDLLTAEWAHRIAESHPTITTGIFGELYANPTLLFRDRHTVRHVSNKSSRRGDSVWVRNDGLRVVFETVRFPHEGASRKVAWWAKQLCEHDWNHNALIVVIVVAGPVTTRARLYRRVAEFIHTHTTTGSLAQPGRPATQAHTRRARAALHIVDWTEWFPGPSTTSTRFDTLTTRFLQNGQWVDAHLANFTGPNAVPYTPQGDSSRRDITPITTQNMLTTPNWLYKPATHHLNT